MKRRLFSLFLALCLLLSVHVGAHAADPTELRHSVATVVVSQILNGYQFSMCSGTCFFVGETGKDPQFAITNSHVISPFSALGGGKDFEINYYKWIDLMAAQGFDKDRMRDRWNSATNYANDSVVRMQIDIYFSQDNSCGAYLVEEDSVNDYAILRLAEPTKLRGSMPISIPNQEMVSKDCYTVGYPGIADYLDHTEKWGENDATVNKGTVSRLTTSSGSGTPLVQTDTVFHHGNSGGPLVLDANGAAIGITTSSLLGERFSSSAAVYYAVSMDIVKLALDRNSISYTLLEYPAPAAKSALPLPIWAIALIAAAVLAAVLFLAFRKMPGKVGKTPAASPAPVSNSAPAAAKSADDYGYRIQGVSGALEGKRFSVPAGKKTLIGRNPKECGIVLPADTPGVSGKHCAVWIEKGAVYLMDLSSSHGTFLAPGKRLAANEAVKLQEGDVVWLGGESQSFVLTKKKVS